MSYLADIYRNFDAHFAEGNSSMVYFPNSMELGSIVFIGFPGSGKVTLLSQLNEKFRPRPGSAHIEPGITRGEIRNVIFRMPIIDCPSQFNVYKPLSIFESCKVIIVVIDATSELPEELLLNVGEIRDSLNPPPEIHVFLNKVDLLDSVRSESILSSLKKCIREKINGSVLDETSINNGTALYQVGLCIGSLLPRKTELKDLLNQFVKSLGLSHSFLIDLQSRVVFLESDVEPVDIESFLITQDGVEMFVGISTMMDARSAQAVASVELKDGRFFHFFWSAYDVILAGIADHRVPSATAKNNVIALLHSIKRVLS
jgi:signal recognition particle receptor subunit beta